jgi:hypothetical protein
MAMEKSFEGIALIILKPFDRMLWAEPLLVIVGETPTAVRVKDLGESRWIYLASKTAFHNCCPRYLFNRCVGSQRTPLLPGPGSSGPLSAINTSLAVEPGNQVAGTKRTPAKRAGNWNGSWRVSSMPVFRDSGHPASSL